MIRQSEWILSSVCFPVYQKNPVHQKILKGEPGAPPQSRELIIVAYSTSVNILVWFFAPVDFC